MRFHGELSEWPKEHDWKSCIRRKRILGSNPRLSARQTRGVLRGAASPLRRGGRVVECGGLENRLGPRSYEGSNPSSSAILSRRRPAKGRFSCQGKVQGIRTGRSWQASGLPRAERSEANERCRRQRGNPSASAILFRRRPAKGRFSCPAKVHGAKGLPTTSRVSIGVLLVCAMFRNGINAPISIARICIAAVRYFRIEQA